ncbi:MAG: creatininase family protein [Planctomycetaceae bacterium]
MSTTRGFLHMSFDLDHYFPERVNDSPWLAAHTLNHLLQLPADRELILPICSLGTRFEELSELGSCVLPPLYHEALGGRLKQQILERITICFPYHELCESRHRKHPQLRIVELPPRQAPAVSAPRILAFSVDTAVEEHGPHLPLSTDTLQSYAVLQRLAQETDGLLVGPPLEYGQLTWGLPFGFSVDLTADLLREYVRNFANAMLDWIDPESLFVVDVHGSQIHRTAIVEGLQASQSRRFRFRWLHEPLVGFAADRGDQHAGGVETALIEFINPQLVDPDHWPDGIDALADKQMPFATAVELTPDLAQFTRYVEKHSLNGIVGDIYNYRQLDSAVLMSDMLNTARLDLQQLSTNP